MIDNIENLIAEIDLFTKSAVSESRYEHSVRTAKMCQELCLKFGIDEKLGYLAGISHDMCKKLPDDVMMAVAARDGNPISDFEKNKPSLLHGRAAAVKLYEDFNVTDKDLIDAVANHTFGKVGLGDLGKILYVADKIEPGRKHVTPEYIKVKFNLSLDKMVKEVLKENTDYLILKGRAVAEESLAFYRSL